MKFREIISSEKPVLVDFHAEWCGPCKVMAPILKNLKERMGDDISVLKIDVDKNPSVSAQYKISGVPTLILFQRNKILWRQSGVVQLSQLEQIVKQFTS